jgi:hypothetical protein
MSQAVERGGPVPVTRPDYVPKVPKSPECYAQKYPVRIDEFPEKSKILIDPDELNQPMNQSQDEGWRHELDHDVESVFWLLLYWAMVAQPKGAKGGGGGYIPAGDWAYLIGDVEERHRLVSGLSSGNPPNNLTHSDYKPLGPLISRLAAILVVDRHWLPESDVRKRPGYICEAFQRLILEFIISNRDEDFMTCLVDDTLRTVQPLPLSTAQTTTPMEAMDGSDRENRAKRRRVSRTEVGCVCAIFEFLSFLLLCSQDEDDNGSR